MFNVTLESVYPIQYIEIYSFEVRGALGPMSIWTTTEGGFENKHEAPEQWTIRYNKHHNLSFDKLEKNGTRRAFAIVCKRRVSRHIYSLC